MKLSYPVDFIDRVICGDALEVMRQMPDGCVDLVITSLPFGVGKEYERDQNFGDIGDLVSPTVAEQRRDFEREITFDELLRLLRESFVAWERIVKPGGYVVVEFGDIIRGWKLLGLTEPCELPVGWIYWAFGLSAGFLLQSQRIWQKRFERIIASSRQAISAPRAVLEIEHLYTFRRKGGDRQKIRNRGISQRAIWSSQDSSEQVLKEHPASFPEVIPSNAIQIYTDEGDIVLDPYLGSGTTAVAAKHLGRHYIGVDISSEYCQIAERRLAEILL